MSTGTNFALLDLKNDNIWLTLKSCSCAQNSFQGAFQAHYSFGKLGGYKYLYCKNTMKLIFNVGVSGAL